MKPIQYSFFKSNDELKKNVKDDLMNSWKEANIVTAITKFIPGLIFSFVLILIFISLFYTSWYISLGAKKWDIDTINNAKKFFLWLKWTVDARFKLYLLAILIYVLSNPLKVGCENYFLQSAKNTNTLQIKDVFKFYKQFFKIASIDFRRKFFMFIGIVVFIFDVEVIYPASLDLLLSTFFLIGLSFVVIGVVNVLNSAVVYQVYLENPDLPRYEIFQKTKLLMNDRILAYTKLMLSFIGWDLLSIFTLFILSLRVSSYKASTKSYFYLDLL